MDGILNSLFAGLVSGTVLSAIVTLLFHRRAKRIEAEIKNQYDQSLAVFQSERSWKEKSVADLLGPANIQFDRTKRAFERWQGKNLYLEAKVIMQGNTIIRDLLLTNSHLIPQELLPDAGKLIEHYDRWLEEFERLRASVNPDLKAPFVFVGPQGFPFPKQSN